MIILDTDCLSLLDREKIIESSKLRNKLKNFPLMKYLQRSLPLRNICVAGCLISQKSKTIEQQIYPYQRLHRFLESYRKTKCFRFRRKISQSLPPTKIKQNPHRHNGFENRFDCNCE